MNTELLNEEIERFKLLSGYHTDKTLTENYILLEDGLFGRVLQNLTKAKAFDDAAIALKELPMFKGAGDDAAKTFLTDLRAGGKSLSKEQLKSFQTQLLKDKTLANSAAKDLVDAAAEGYAKQLLNSKGKAAVIFQNAQMKDRPRLLKNAGYSGNASQRIIDKYVQVEKELIKKGGKPGGQQTAKQGADAAGDASGQAAKQGADAAGDASGQVAKQGADTTKKGVLTRSKEALTKYKDQLINSLKTKGWKRTLAVATGLGITGAILWQLAKDNGVQTEDLPPVKPKDTGGERVVTGRATQFRANEEFPLMFMDSGEKVKQLQTALGVKNRAGKPNITGNFYTATEALLKPRAQELGVNYTRETGVSQDLFNKIVNTPSTEEIVDRPNRELVQPVTVDRKKPNLNVQPNLSNLRGPNVNAIQNQRTPEQYYNELVRLGLIDSIEQGGNRIKYNGPKPDENVIKTITQHLNSLGYSEKRQRNKNNGEKVVIWTK